MSKKTILIIDDTEINLEIMNDILGQKYEVMAALDGEFALNIAINDMPNLILLDITMPKINGYEVCKRLKENKKTRDIPVIFITAKTDEESIEKAYDVGGIDYVTKPFKRKELLARVKTQMKVQDLIQDLKKSKEELKVLASTDYLTKLYNRRYFSKISKNILDLEKRENQIVSIVMLDIDKFKNVNDIYGHQVGDDVLVSLSNILTTNKRKSDILCRYGGEEFVILLPNTSLENAKMVSEKIRKDVESYSMKFDSKEDLKFTVSFGVSELNKDEKNIEPSLKRADDALYEAKKSGRNKVCSG